MKNKQIILDGQFQKLPFADNLGLNPFESGNTHIEGLGKANNTFDLTTDRGFSTSKAVESIIGDIAPSLIKGYYDGKVLVSPVRGYRLGFGYWIRSILHDSRVAIRMTSEPSVFEKELTRSPHQCIEGILIENIFLIHYPGVTLAPSKTSYSVGQYVGKNFLSQQSASDKEVLEIGTGTGVISFSIIKNSTDIVNILATDIDSSVLSTAELNARIGEYDMSRFSLSQGSIYDAVDRNARFDIIVSNPPFYDTLEAEKVITTPQYTDHVPLKAIDGGNDGLFFYKKILDQPLKYIKPGGKIVLQVSPKISEQVLDIGKGILGSYIQDAYVVSKNKRTAKKGIMVVFEIGNI